MTKAHCNKCLGERNHDVLHTHQTKWEDDEYPVGGSDDYQLLKCCGCERISLRHLSWFSEHCDYDGTLIPTVTYYPPSISRSRPSWYNHIQSIEGLGYLTQLLDEIHIGLQNGTTCMAVMAIRAML